MWRRTLWLAVWVLLGVTPAAASPWRSRFLDEALTSGPTRWTAEFHAYYRDSYIVDKLDLARRLSRRARARGLRLRAILVLGPTGPLWTYRVWTFVEERGRVRASLMVMPHARVTAKATVSLSHTAFDRVLSDLEDCAFMQQAPSLDAIEARLDAEEAVQPTRIRHSLGDFRFHVLFAQYGPRGPSFFYAKLDPPGEAAAVEQLNDALTGLTTHLRQTYAHGDRGLGPFEKPRALGELTITTTQRHARDSELDAWLAQNGYSSFTTTERTLGMGLDLVFERWRGGYTLEWALPRHALRPAGASEAVLHRQALTLVLGYDVVETANMSTFPLLGLGWSNIGLDVDPRGLPALAAAGAKDRVTLERDAFTLLAGIGVSYVIPLGPRKYQRHPAGVLVGTRLGYSWGFAQTAWASKEPELSFLGPDTNLDGLFLSLALGWGNISAR